MDVFNRGQEPITYWYVDKFGKLLGGFPDKKPLWDVAAIEVPDAPDDKRDTWDFNYKKWVDHPNKYAERRLELYRQWVDGHIVEAFMDAMFEGDKTKLEALQAQRQEIKDMFPKSEGATDPPWWFRFRP